MFSFQQWGIFKWVRAQTTIKVGINFFNNNNCFLFNVKIYQNIMAHTLLIIELDMTIKLFQVAYPFYRSRYIGRCRGPRRRPSAPSSSRTCSDPWRRRRRVARLDLGRVWFLGRRPWRIRCAQQNRMTWAWRRPCGEMCATWTLDLNPFFVLG